VRHAAKVKGRIVTQKIILQIYYQQSNGTASATADRTIVRQRKIFPVNTMAAIFPFRLIHKGNVVNRAAGGRKSRGKAGVAGQAPRGARQRETIVQPTIALQQWIMTSQTGSSCYRGRNQKGKSRRVVHVGTESWIHRHVLSLFEIKGGHDALVFCQSILFRVEECPFR
jgi:hypothetical protein